MKITRRQLRRIIKEEMSHMREGPDTDSLVPPIGKHLLKALKLAGNPRDKTLTVKTDAGDLELEVHDFSDDVTTLTLDLAKEGESASNRIRITVEEVKDHS